MKRTTLSTALYIFLVFLSGAVVGAFAHRLYTVNTVVSAKPDEVRHHILDEMRTRLSLSDDQVKQLNAIMDSTKTRYQEVKKRWDEQSKQAAKPELKAITEDQHQKVKAILSEPQRVEYEKYLAERQKRREQQQGSNAATTAPASH
jgi:predicted nuclease with TOPRIM domain